MLVLLDVAICGWTTISQSRFGAQLGEIQAQMRGNQTQSEPVRLLGFLWNAPVRSTTFGATFFMSNRLATMPL